MVLEALQERDKRAGDRGAACPATIKVRTRGRDATRARMLAASGTWGKGAGWRGERSGRAGRGSFPPGLRDSEGFEGSLMRPWTALGAVLEPHPRRCAGLSAGIAAVSETVDDGQGHGVAAEDLAPGAEGLVGDHKERAVLVACADEFEDHAGLRILRGHVGEVVEDEQMVLVEFDTAGTRVKSKLSSVLPGGSFATARA